MNKVYKKSYKIFVLWLIMLIVSMVSFGILNYYVSLRVNILYLIVSTMLTILFAIIYKTENIYWINGIDFEYSSKLTSQDRKSIALKYLKLFGLINIMLLVYSILGFIFSIPWIIDTIIFALLMLGGAIYTIKFQRSDF